jgi:hypothetical protein
LRGSGKHKSAYKIPNEDVKDQKEEIAFTTSLTGRTRSPGFIKLQRESPEEGIRNGGDDIRPPEKTGDHQENESEDNFEKTWL